MIPSGFERCPVCGEFNGETKAKNLSQGSATLVPNPESVVTVLCLCGGIPCPRCKKNKIHRPISNSYHEKTNTVGHWPYFAGMMVCRECRAETSQRSGDKNDVYAILSAMGRRITRPLLARKSVWSEIANLCPLPIRITLKLKESSKLLTTCSVPPMLRTTLRSI